MKLDCPRNVRTNVREGSRNDAVVTEPRNSVTGPVFTALAPLKIGDIEVANRVLLAPMSGVTDAPFRRLAASLGAGLVVSEMTVRPPIERYCFGPPDPARSPRPAATIITAVRFGVGIVICQGQSGGETGRWFGRRTALITLPYEKQKDSR